VGPIESEALIGTIYIGWDERDYSAFEVCVASLYNNSPEIQSGQIRIVPLVDWKLRKRGLFMRRTLVTETGQKYDIRDERPHSTAFTYTRFLTPYLEYMDGGHVALFMDCDMLATANIAELFAYADMECDVQCVHHDYDAKDEKKIGGLVQQHYPCKNWSSVMLFPDVAKITERLNPLVVSMAQRDWLHTFQWAENVGNLPRSWNWLDGEESQSQDANLVHFTRGTPDIEPEVNEESPYAKLWWEYAVENCHDLMMDRVGRVN
jgi:hypothetical protein